MAKLPKKILGFHGQSQPPGTSHGADTCRLFRGCDSLVGTPGEGASNGAGDSHIPYRISLLNGELLLGATKKEFPNHLLVGFGLMKFNFNGFVVFLRRFFAGTDWESLGILLFILANEVETGDFDQPMDNFPHMWVVSYRRPFL